MFIFCTFNADLCYFRNILEMNLFHLLVPFFLTVSVFISAPIGFFITNIFVNLVGEFVDLKICKLRIF